MATETVYYGGTILPMTGENDRLEALLVRDGIIAAAGTLEQVKAAAGADAQWVDLGGKTLMPSFIDGHSHIPMAAQFADFADLSGCTNMAQIRDTLKAYQESRHIGPDGVIFGCNYDNNFLDEERHPDKFLLDQVSTEVPIFIFHTSAHMGVANSRLLDMIGYTADTPDPQNGRIGRVPGTAEPNGYLEEAGAYGPVLMKLFAGIKMDMGAQMAKIQQEYLRYGVTTAQDGASSERYLQMLAAIGKAGGLKLDVVSYVVCGPDVVETLKKYPDYLGKYKDHFKIGGLKTVLDGSPQGRTAWLSRPYENSGDYCAYPYMNDEALYQVCRTAVDNGLQLLAHCNGDAASEQFLTQYARVAAENPAALDLRPVMIHCQTVRRDQLDRMVGLKMLPSFFIGHTYYWGDVHLKNLGPERGAHISPVRSALERGLIYNFHQDTPVTRPDMMHSVWCAVNRRTRKGVSIGADETIGVYDALKGITCNAAYAYFEEDRKGTLEVGKLADLVVLERNPLSVDPMALQDIAVSATIKEGQIVYGGL